MDPMIPAVTPEPPPLLTSKEAAAILNRSAKTVIRMAIAGTLPVAHRLPGTQGAFLFRRADVEARAAAERAEAAS